MLRKFKAATLSAAVVMGVLAASQSALAVSSLTAAEVHGDWTGTYQYTSPPQVLSADTMTITEETPYQTDPQAIKVSFMESGDGLFDFIPVIDDNYFDDAYRRLESALISGNQLTWSEIIADEINHVMTDITRIQYTLAFSEDLAQQYLDGNYTSTFLIGSTEQPEAQQAFSLMQNFAQDDEDEAQFWATSGDIHLARPLPTVNPPVSAIPLPPAFSAGLALLGGLGVIGILHQRRRTAA